MILELMSCLVKSEKWYLGRYCDNDADVKARHALLCYI